MLGLTTIFKRIFNFFHKKDPPRSICIPYHPDILDLDPLAPFDNRLIYPSLESIPPSHSFCQGQIIGIIDENKHVTLYIFINNKWIKKTS